MNNDLAESYHAFLESLKGKTVTIYRGGPESKTGLLLDVKSDYVTLYSQNNNNNNNQNNQQNNQQNNNNQNSVIYYQAKHVKSISEDSITNSTQTTQVNQENVEFLKAEDFVGLIKNLLKETIQINQGGPESKYGTLLGVSNDFIAIYTEDDGIVYFNVNHVKSVSKYQDNNNNQNSQQNNQNVQNIVTQQVYPEIIEAKDFQNVFQHLAHKWVSINRGGPEAMEGVLVENVGGHYTLVSNQEVLRIHPYHIKSISSGPKGSLSENNQSDDNNENEQNNQTVQNNSNQTKSNNKNKNRESKKSSSSRNVESKREKVVKTIDYVWKGIN
ncbi:spore coat protein [Neobacillus sp. LXY-4]|uniref:spore coat protein n=1 Tax=Neobacillus sp. LXY-4 TaxID=3379826 RepID=UPI003EDF55D5